MKNDISDFRSYLINISSCTLLVLAFAALQYHVIEGAEFRLTDYGIPFLVGSIFGFLITRIRFLQRKYKAEKDMVLEKNRQIHSYVGTIIHDFRSPVAAILGLTNIVLEEKDSLDPVQK